MQKGGDCLQSIQSGKHILLFVCPRVEFKKEVTRACGFFPEETPAGGSFTFSWMCRKGGVYKSHPESIKEGGKTKGEGEGWMMRKWGGWGF